MIDIIIPVYNTPINDLKRCLDSILNQSYTNYKVYIIDDGSKDIIKEFLDDYIKNKPNFFVKHILNGGISNARNMGIEISNNEYLTFIDSDDTVSQNFLKESYDLITKYDLDLIIGGYNEIENNKINKTRKCINSILIYDKNNINLFFDKLLSGEITNDNKEIDSAPIGRIYTRLYKRNIINKLRFDKNVNMSEDTLFMIDLMYQINKIGLVPNIWYNYYQNNYSIVHNKDYKKLINNTLIFIDEIYKRMNKEKNLTIKNAYKMRILKTILNINDILEKNNDIVLKKQIFNQDIIINSLMNINIDNYINITNKEINFLKEFNNNTKLKLTKSKFNNN